MLALLLSLQASMGVPAGGGTTIAACSLQAPTSNARVVRLYATCGQRAVWLGNAESYRSSYNPVLRSLLVIRVLQAQARVYLVSLDGDGLPLIDDITRTLVKLTGKYPDAPLTSEMDISTFATDGLVKVSNAALQPRSVSKLWTIAGVDQARGVLDVAAFLGASK